MKTIISLGMSTFLTLSLISTTVQATEMPVACPNVETIQKAGFMGVQESKDYKLYAVYQISKFEKPEVWGFIMGVPFDQAITKGDAMNKAKNALKTLTGTPQPTAVDEKNKQWYCMYKNQYDYVSFAVTPLSVSESMHSVLKVMR